MATRLRFLGRLFSSQANAYVNSKLRRVNQLYTKYQRIAFSQLFSKSKFSHKFHSNIRRKTPMLMLGTCSFNFREAGISDDEVARCVEEFEILKPRSPPPPCSTPSCSCAPKRLNIDEFRKHLLEEGYEPVIEREDLHIWRKREEGLANYKYKVIGTFNDVPARAFFAVQCDTEYRKKWDKLVVEVDVIQQEHNSDVIYWHMYYPFPMSSRDYVFVRRNLIDEERGCMVVVSHAVEHPDCPVRKGVVRVGNYMSDMVISPHKSFDENGLDYLLTYYDDPQSSFPSFVYARMAASGVHDYIGKLHEATRRFNEGTQVSCAAQNSRLKDNLKHTSTPVQLEIA